AAQKRRDLSVDDLKDAFGVSYEAAAHRFTNLATVDLGIRCHFQKVHETGVIHKAYENDGIVFPADHTGAIEGQQACRKWGARQAFSRNDRFRA
ncbi:XRE family transcriptional regulator, partial [Micrococcus luteus]|nr:XRE family transcriptional regulator [Micrococcus luteus]